MTTAEQNHNYFSNLARIAGFWKGITSTYAMELTQERSYFTKEEIAEKLNNAIALADKWFEHRYEGPFWVADIEAMMKAKPSDTDGVCPTCKCEKGQHNSLCPDNFVNSDSYQYQSNQ